MTQLKRRTFLTAALGGLAGSPLLNASIGESLSGASDPGTTHEAKTPGNERFWQVVAGQFRLQPGLRYFNNASLGPSPRPVADATEAARRMLDAFPSRYMWGGWKDEVEAVRTRAGKLFAVSPESIAIIHNTTEGMNLVAASLELDPGDEVIIADHEHPSGTIPWQYWQEPKGVKLVRPVLPLAPKSPGEIVDVYREAITDRTRVISMCHMVNTNGMILPIAEVSELARKHNILVAVDGAQSAAMLEIDLDKLGCDFYSTSAHKWLFSPKGVGLFYARKASQHLLKPLIVASGWEDDSIRRLENYNTRNLPEVLGLGAALDFHNLIGPSLKEARIRELKRYLLDGLADNDRARVQTPTADNLSCGIITVGIDGLGAVEIRDALAEHDIDCRPMSLLGLDGVRISVSVFTTKADVDYLLEALREV
ncbi:MAG: aminotransferase class V-fold PLP-dependent enzyme [bacterium]|nr:aminotransferase class V-fold PLP-dependent enzyme [bacterium]